MCSKGCESQHPSHPTAAGCLKALHSSSAPVVWVRAAPLPRCAVQAGFYLTGESVWEREQQLLHLETFICFLFYFF